MLSLDDIRVDDDSENELINIDDESMSESQSDSKLFPNKNFLSPSPSPSPFPLVIESDDNSPAVPSICLPEKLRTPKLKSIPKELQNDDVAYPPLTLDDIVPDSQPRMTPINSGDVLNEYKDSDTYGKLSKRPINISCPMQIISPSLKYTLSPFTGGHTPNPRATSGHYFPDAVSQYLKHQSSEHRNNMSDELTMSNLQEFNDSQQSESSDRLLSLDDQLCNASTLCNMDSFTPGEEYRHMSDEHLYNANIPVGRHTPQQSQMPVFNACTFEPYVLIFLFSLDFFFISNNIFFVFLELQKRYLLSNVKVCTH